MTTKKAIQTYLTGAFLQIGIVCCIIAILRACKIDYGWLGFLFLAVGGTSTALWGTIVSKRVGRVTTYQQILKDFFRINGNATSWKQGVCNYGFLCVCLLVLFGIPIFTGATQENIHWYSFLIFFVQSIIFGGIEEIGWRYTFQPLVEKHVPYEIASLITFACWGIWHYAYFYIVDTIGDIDSISFLIGLLASCFIMGAIYRTTKSLWLCVLYHSLLNVFSQTMLGLNRIQTIVTAIVCVMLSIIWVHIHKKK